MARSQETIIEAPSDRHPWPAKGFVRRSRDSQRDLPSPLVLMWRTSTMRHAFSAAELTGSLASPSFPSDLRSFRPTPLAPGRVRRHRTIFISDVHLGTRGCKAELLADFLAHNDCATLYLVGDIVDGWRLKRSWYWNEAHSRVINEILHKARNGTRVIYVPGNHDEDFRGYCGLNLAGVELRLEMIHETADGKRFLVLHGDQFDGVVAYAKWLAHLGDWAYTMALALNTLFNAWRRAFGLPYWSLSAYLKHKVKNAAQFISNFETALAREASERGADGVICGHIHHAELREIGGILYCNDGDWVESCSALTEDAHGCLEIVHWTCLAGEQGQQALKLRTRSARAIPARAAAA
jgi:UDP-2,3-diacylglucosamine pyrophosphatase LpxH